VHIAGNTVSSARDDIEVFDRRSMLQQQREDIDAVLAEIAIIERDCRRRLKSDEAAAVRAGKAASRSG